MEIIHKIVQFDEYCPKCVYRDYDEAANPCYECLTMPANVHTAEPIYFKEGKAKVIKTRKEKK